MLESSDYDVADALALLGKHDIDATLLVPTHTGMEKSIMDATGPVRDYLAAHGYHDYEKQGQGPDHKVTRAMFFVRPRSLERSTVSLYRPLTKSGDPRIWLGRETRANAAAGNLLALVLIDEDLFALNMSDPAVRASLGDEQSPFRVALARSSTATDPAEELLEKLKTVCARGYVTTLRPGDTGVGMTLETLLGIAANARRDPDYKGIEIKAQRHGRRGKTVNRSTLFSKVPSWKLSPVGSAMGLLERRGYENEDGRLQLYHTLSGSGPNSLGLFLELDEEKGWLKQCFRDAASGKQEHDVTWELERLRKDLAAKHAETFWVKARCRGKGADEQFHYVEVHHTRAPMVSNLDLLLDSGIVTVDYALHFNGQRARDHGYLFKIHPSKMDALFPPPREYLLA